MITISAPQNNNRLSFTAFNKPQKSVFDHFAGVVCELNPENRKVFVSEIDKLVKSAEGCPVPIDHEIAYGVSEYYTPVVRGKHIVTSKKHNCRANYILDVMSKAVNYAKNLADADANINELKKIFNF